MKVRGIKRTFFYGKILVRCDDWRGAKLLSEEELKSEYGHCTVKSIDFDGWNFVVELESSKKERQEAE